ncbi:metallophosphoesterase [Demequina globuliformis]|uniref:metallophosphoesterase n=1 Tax=Demequina globuliformis TaxID=676202 RepID=UPI000785B048|nr:metallophosphoesterase [Demequina globuliformis]
MNVSALATAVLAAVTAAVLVSPTASGAQWPPPQPDRHDPLWQVTEVVANSPNVRGADAFEYIEVRNASDGPLAWDDVRVRYVRPLVDLTTVWTVEWPTATPGVMVEPGQALVLWVRGDATDGLTVADFNAAYGTALVEGETLAMVEGNGLSNSALRGVELSTNFGVQLARAYYNEDGNADATAKQGIGVQYAPTREPGGVQERLATAAPSPGVVPPEHREAAAIAQPAPGEAPVIVDDTTTSFSQGRGVDITAWIRDDGLVFSAEVELWTDLDPEPVTYPLARDQAGTRTVHLGAADTLGRSQIHYRITAWDGSQRTTTDQATLTSRVSDAAVRVGGGHEGVPLGADLVVDPLPLVLTRLDGDVVAGEVDVVAAGDAFPEELTLAIDGSEVEGVPSLEHEPVFAFDATLTDPYFRNGVRMGEDVLHVFDTGTYGATETVETSIPLGEIEPGVPVTVQIVSGTKAAPEVDDHEANDDFLVTNVRLTLPDGRTLRPRDAQPGMLSIGDGGGATDVYDAVFDIPEDAFTGERFTWDTTQALDGDHVFSASSAAGEAQVRLTVDNSAPEVTPSIGQGAWVRGEATLDASVADAVAGVDAVTATVDGRAVRLPHTLSSLTETPGPHTFTVTATDKAGNTATVATDFAIPTEQPSVASVGVAGGSTLTATVNDASGDMLDIDFARGQALALGDHVKVLTGATAWSGDIARAEAQPASAADLARLDAAGGEPLTTTSTAQLPYVLLRADLTGAAGDNARVTWTGAVNAPARVTLSVLDDATGAWEPHDSRVTAEDGEDVSLEALVPVALAGDDGILEAVIQHTDGYAARDLSERAVVDEPHHPEDTPRDAYDFTLAWESDTQYYNAREDIYDRQLSIHDYLLEVREDINLQYMVHTGDIVDWSNDEEQWKRADAAYSPLDDAGLPYGVLAGNHDVDQTTNDYGPYSQWFGDARFADNPWFGGSHEDNRGHYDLITAGGIDFLFLYMGWGAMDEQIAWMNDTLAAYPERVAVVSLHEYMLTTGGLGPLPQRIFDEVIATQPTVRFVLSGHYHDAYTRLDSFDDNGDGDDDRTVTSMLFDYQDLPDGGQGYLRLLHFDNEARTIQVRTYSDYLGDYTAVHPALDDAHQDFAIPYTQAGIAVEAKTLVTDTVGVDVLSEDVIASFSQVRALTEVAADWAGETDGSWYVRATDPYGAVVVSDVVPGSAVTTLTSARH